MTIALPQAAAHACFTSNASLRPGHHVIVLHEAERLFFNIGFDAVQGNPSGASHCMRPGPGTSAAPPTSEAVSQTTITLAKDT